MSRAAATCHPDRPLRSQGKCNACYMKARKAGAWVPGRTGVPASGHRTRERHVVAPRPRPEPMTQEQKAQSARVASARWRAAHPGSHRASMLRLRYGMTQADYDAMLAAQGGVCAICGQPPRHRARGGGIAPLYVDHDHATGQVRGLLCLTCNRDVGILEGPLYGRLVAYLDGRVALGPTMLVNRPLWAAVAPRGGF